MQVYGINGTTIADVDATTNALKVQHPQSVNATNSAKVGFVFLACGPNNRALTSYGPMGRLAVGVQTLELFDPIDGAAVNALIWNQSASTMTIVQSGTTGFMVLNANASLGINASAQVTTIKQMQLINTFVPTSRILFKTPNGTQTNAVMEVGYGFASGVAAPTDAAILRWSNGEFRCVTVFNSGETASGPLTAPTPNVVHTFHSTYRGTKVEFWVDEILIAEVTNPGGNPSPTLSSRVPIYARAYNLGTAPVTAPEIHVAAVSLWRNDLNTNKLWPYQMVSIGRGGYQSPVTPFSQTQQFANSGLPAAAVLSNTAASYTTPGGLFRVTTAFTANQDNLLFAFQIPTGFQFYITDITIGGAVTTVLGAVATALHWGLAMNASAVSLATTDNFPTNVYAYRRLYLCTQGLISAAVAGTQLQPFVLGLQTPHVVDSGRFIGVILRAAASPLTGEIQGGVTLGGYFE